MSMLEANFEIKYAMIFLNGDFDNKICFHGQVVDSLTCKS